jgi:hypothetical protein
VTYNKNLLNLNYTIYNDGIQTYSVNATVQTYAVFSKMLIYFKYKILKSPNDTSYRRESMNTVVDVEKVFRGNQKDIVMVKIAEALLKFCKCSVRFPLLKVN